MFFSMPHFSDLSRFEGIVERFHEGIESGAIQLQGEPSDHTAAEVVCLTYGEAIRLLTILFREHYPPGPFPLPAPTTAPPGTKRKVAELARRVKNGSALFHPADADMANAYITVGAGRAGTGKIGGIVKVLEKT